MRQQDGLEWSNSGAPISQVLNHADSTTQHASENQYAPFSGKLIDLLLDTSLDTTHGRRRALDQGEDFPRSVENTVITLPQPAQPQSRTARRPRIPPLLQGLHQPPPLPPNGRLFPPITDGVSGFEREIRDRVHIGNVAHDNSIRNEEEGIFCSNIEPDSPHRVRSNHIGRDRTHNPLMAPPLVREGRRKSGESRPTGVVPKASESSSRKRKKWSEEETKDLLLGVSRFGIGNWKKILLCPEFKFVGRTAVDLKDKFRVCCPGEGTNSTRAKRRKEVDTEATRLSGSFSRSLEDVSEWRNTENTRITTSSTDKPFAEGAGDVHMMDQTELAKLGIQTPFAKSTRRPRHAFIASDDDNLLKGFNKHGAAWLSIRDDKELGFETRRPTDLRDRFRIRYPEAYAKAGLKGKVKPPAKDREAQKENQASQESLMDYEPGSSQSKEIRTYLDHPRATKHSTKQHPLHRSSAMHPPYHRSAYPNIDPRFLDDYTADEDGSSSPIILNRDILQWADANTASMSSSSNAPYYTNYLPRDIPPATTTTFPNDGLHINPMATLKLPMLTLSDHTPYPHIPDPNTSSSTLMWPSFSRPQSDNHLLRTPNLPTIVFPHVPAISARTTVHNLPTPADLLSGMDLDGGEVGSGVEYGGGLGMGSDSMDLRVRGNLDEWK